MSAPVATPAAPAPAPAATLRPRPSLARAELRRFSARRLVRLLLALSALVFVGGVVLATLEHSRTTPAVVAEATERRQASFEEQERFRQQCLAEPQPPEVPPEAACGSPTTVDQLGRVEDWLDKRPFTLDVQGRGGLTAVAVAVAGLAFLLGATYVGAEWSTRSMVALLFWEPRRVRVLSTKLAVLAGASAVLAVLAQTAWLVVARYLLAATRGTTAVPDGTWSELVAASGRGVLLAVLLGALGFGIANLLRNTAAAFGFAFVWFVIVENVVRALRPSLQPYLLTENVTALLTQGGGRVWIQETSAGAGGTLTTGRELVVSNLHGALVLTAVVAVVVALGMFLFVRRDLD